MNSAALAMGLRLFDFGEQGPTTAVTATYDIHVERGTAQKMYVITVRRNRALRLSVLRARRDRTGRVV